MILRAPRPIPDGDEVALWATMEFARSGREPFELRFGVPADLADSLDRGANPFLPIATLVAARTGEDLTLDAPVSPRMLEGARKAGATFGEWWGYRVPVIEPEGGTAIARGGRAVALMYSRGVDTAATLVRSLNGEIPERVTHLLSGDGIEWCYSAEVEREIWLDHERAAAELGLPLVRLTSNARELLRGLIGWPRSFGAAYIGAALALGPMFAHIVTGATQPIEGGEPRGSRWDLDPLWSTETTEVRQDAAELDRAERVAIVATHETSVRWLKVCWEGRGAGNCGRCMKCLRTMTALAAAGVLEQAKLFEAPLTPEAVRAAPLSDLMPPIPSIAESVPEGMPELRAAWEEKAVEWRQRQRRRRRELAVERVRDAAGRRARRAVRRLRRSRRRATRAPQRAPALLRGARRLRRRARKGLGRVLGRS